MNKISLQALLLLTLSHNIFIHAMIILPKKVKVPRVQSLPQKPIQSIKTEPIIIPALQTEGPQEATGITVQKIPPLGQKKRLMSVPTSGIQETVLGNYMRNLWNRFIAYMSGSKPVTPRIYYPSSFGLGGQQKRQYSVALSARKIPSDVEKISFETRVSVERESDKIIKKLRRDGYYWFKDEILIESIKSFFEKNSIENIENLYASILRSTFFNDYFFIDNCIRPLLQEGKIKAHKLLPLIETLFDHIMQKNSSLMFVVFEFMSNDNDFIYIEKLFNKVLQQNPESMLEYLRSDSHKNPRALENFRQKFFQKINININSLLSHCSALSCGVADDIMRSLPREGTKGIDAIEHFYDVVTLKQGLPYSEVDKLPVVLMIKILKDYLPTIKNEQYRERLYRIIIKNARFVLPIFGDFYIDFGNTQAIEAITAMFLDILGKDINVPSYRHYAITSNNSALLLALISNINSPYFINMIQQIMHKEKELIDQRYEVFYHGRRWQYGFLSDIYSMLYSYKSGKNLDDFIFTHLDDPVLGKVSEKFYASETAKRERLIKEGNPYDSKEHSFGIANRQSLLFLNKFLFGNLNRPGSCSMAYFLNNRNVGNIEFSVQEIFNMFGCNDAYQVFAKKLEELQQEHDKLSEYGEMLQIAVPKNNIDKCVYYTTSGGPKKEFESKGDGEKIKTTDIKTILAELDKNPEDTVEFVLVETRDKFGGLNPDSGIKVFSYNTVDPAQWAAFKEKEAALLTRIKDWMRQKEQGKMARE